MIHTTYDTTYSKKVDAIAYFQSFPTNYDVFIKKKKD